ncbi:MAG: hypothetical protein AMS21_06355 [Gemmatimonas sp. SG8_38_2]|nr:MAG: hypothetical protein AMS21_06355 [Gemmatimonas sp. SG8_38_2]
MGLRLLVPLVLLWPVLALAAEGTALRRYRGTPVKEMLALVLCIVAYFAVWIAADRLIEGATGTVAVGIVLATVLSLLAVPLLLFAAYKVFGVKPGEANPDH